MKKLLTLILLAFALSAGPAQADSAAAMAAYQLWLEQMAAQGNPTAAAQLEQLRQYDQARARYDELRRQRELEQWYEIERQREREELRQWEMYQRYYGQ